MPRQPVQMGANLAFVEGEFGGPITEQVADITVTTTVKRIVDNNPEALSLTIINLGVNNAYIGLDESVSTTRGVFLESGGGLLSVNVRDDQGLPSREWWAISGDDYTVLYIIRNYRYGYTV